MRLNLKPAENRSLSPLAITLKAQGQKRRAERPIYLDADQKLRTRQNANRRLKRNPKTLRPAPKGFQLRLHFDLRTGVSRKVNPLPEGQKRFPQRFNELEGHTQCHQVGRFAESGSEEHWLEWDCENAHGQVGGNQGVQQNVKFVICLVLIVLIVLIH